MLTENEVSFLREAHRYDTPVVLVRSKMDLALAARKHRHRTESQWEAVVGALHDGKLMMATAVDDLFKPEQLILKTSKPKRISCCLVPKVLSLKSTADHTKPKRLSRIPIPSVKS